MRTEWSGVYGGQHLRLTAYGGGAVRVTRDRSGAFRGCGVSAVCAKADGGWKHTADAEGETFALPGFSVRVHPKDGALTFLRPDGETLLRERPADLAGVQGELHFALSPDEGLYGLGSHEEGYGNLRGHTRLLYQHNLKAVVPVLVSTKGWGILFDMGCLMTFRDGEEGMTLSFDAADSADWYFLYGNGSYASLMEKLRSLTGAAPMLPKYALGYTQSKERYTCAQELADVAAEYRRRGIPLDLIVQDWMSWPEGQWGCKKPDRSRFPEGWPEKLHAMNAKVMVSIWPNMQGDNNPDREEMLREGCMLGNRSTYNAFDPKARALYWKQTRGLYREGVDALWADCTEPFESDWNGHDRPPDEERMRLNTGEAKTCLDPAQISLYSYCHSRGLYEGWRSEPGDRRLLTVTRSSWAGQHRYAAVTWSGDTCATWETLRRHIPEGLNFLAAGEPFWHCDIGGFFTDTKDPWYWRGEFPKGKDDPGYRELYVRWAQYACFLIMMRSHGTDTPREIWQFGEGGEPFYDAIAKCIRMRYRLQAYQYCLLAETCARGIPALRAPALVFPEDPELRKRDDLMMLGDNLLVRPVTRPMRFLPGGKRIPEPDENVEVYLPAGCRWMTPDGQKTYEGGQKVTVRAPLDEVPAFVRVGTVLPLSEAQQYTDERPDAPVELVIWPGADAELTYYEDDGITYRYEEGVYRRVPVRWDDRRRTLTLGAQEGFLKGDRRFIVRLCAAADGREVLYTGGGLVVSF